MKPGTRYHFLVISLICVFLFLSRLSYASPLDNWHVRNSPENSTLRAVTYGNGLFVAVGDAGAILTSPDGMTWTERVSGTSSSFRGVTYGNSLFVAVGSGGSIFISSDGTAWRQKDSTGSREYYGVTFGNGLFVATGYKYDAYRWNPFPLIRTSPDGNVWNDITVGGYSTDQLVSFGNGIFVSLGGVTLTSDDGITWIEKAPITQKYLGSVTFGNGKFIAAGESGTVFTSMDGITWIDGSLMIYETINGVASGYGLFVAVGGDVDEFGYFPNTTLLATSSDGINWALRTSTTKEPLYGITFGNNTFLTVGYSGTILQSDPLSGNCTALLSDDLTLHVPIINFNEAYLQGDAACQSDAVGSIICRVINYGAANPQDYADCQTSTLTSDLKLHVPAGIYKNISYEADFERVATSDDKIMFKLTNAKRN